MNKIKKTVPQVDKDLEGKNEDLDKCSKNLIVSNQEISIQHIQNEKQAEELILAYKKIELQDHEKEERADELFTANNELIYQKHEKEKRALELEIANKELAYQFDEKAKRADELAIANKELLVANIELVFQNVEKEKRANELFIANKELKKKEAQLKEHIRCLEEMMFVISHKVRQPVVNILGLANLIDLEASCKIELNQIMVFIKQSALSLDTFTKELTTMIDDISQNGCDKK